MQADTPFLTAALYKFVDLPDFADLQAPLQACCEANEVKGTLLLAHEGINGTIAGPEKGIRAVLAFLRADPRLSNLVHKESWSPKPPFTRMKVKLKKEIVTLRVPELDPNKTVGQYVKPADWNALLADPDVVARSADRFGSQCIVVAIDAKTVAPGKWEIFTHGGRKATGIDAVE